MATNDNRDPKTRLAVRRWMTRISQPAPCGPSDSAMLAHFAERRARAQLRAAWEEELQLNPEAPAAVPPQWR